MVVVNQAAPISFLKTAYEPADWIAVFLKTYRTGDVAQRVVPLSAAMRVPFQKWLRHLNARGWNIYVSVNAVRPGRSRTRDAIAAVRHVFLEIDADGPGLLASLTTRRDLPPPSYVLHSSPGRLHIFWRVRDFDCSEVEHVQKRLARELATDSAATSCAQTTRLPGFINHKYIQPWRVSVEYLRPTGALPRADFPAVAQTRQASAIRDRVQREEYRLGDRVSRARRFLQSVEPAVSGQHGDLRTFRVCCRVVRGFDLSDHEAMIALGEWNARCAPPWSEQALLEKIHNARQYGHEPIGGLAR